MSSPEDRLRASAEAIDQMPRHELDQALRQLKVRRSARSQMEMLNQQTDLASPTSVELEKAAYELAGDAESRGDLPSAARWYTAAAANDFADASLRLAMIFDALAQSRMCRQDGSLARREELDLVSEACRWYSDALAAGHAEAYELLEKLIDRHLGRSRGSSAMVPSGRPGQHPRTGPRWHQSPEDRIPAVPAKPTAVRPRPQATESSR
jgi:TPR repeat protein